MRRFKLWLLERFLPAWAKESVYQENMALRAEISRKDQRIRELNAYIGGLEMGLRSMQRIVIRNGGET